MKNKKSNIFIGLLCFLLILPIVGILSDIVDLSSGSKNNTSQITDVVCNNTPVPTSGSVDKIYYDSSLSEEKVIKIIENANLEYTTYDGDEAKHYNVYIAENFSSLDISFLDIPGKKCYHIIFNHSDFGMAIPLFVSSDALEIYSEDPELSVFFNFSGWVSEEYINQFSAYVPGIGDYCLNGVLKYTSESNDNYNINTDKIGKQNDKLNEIFYI